MKRRRLLGYFTAMAGVVSSQVAMAENAIYQGPCDRAREVSLANKIDKIVIHNSYKSVALLRIAGDYEKNCPAETFIFRELKLKSRSSANVVFDVKGSTIKVGNPGNAKPCERLHLWNDATYGTLSFRLTVENKNEVCEVVVYGDWVIKDRNSPSYEARFSDRVIMLNEGSMVMAQPRFKDGHYFAPITFSSM